jgi:hypothetical protein
VDSDGAWTTLVPAPRCPERVAFVINRDDLRRGPRCPHPLENACFLTQDRRTSNAPHQRAYRANRPAFSTLSTAPTAAGWVSFRRSNGSVFSYQSSGVPMQVGTFSMIKWVCFRLTKTFRACPERSEGSVPYAASLISRGYHVPRDNVAEGDDSQFGPAPQPLGRVCTLAPALPIGGLWLRASASAGVSTCSTRRIVRLDADRLYLHALRR